MILDGRLGSGDLMVRATGVNPACQQLFTTDGGAGSGVH